jgi:hypothetical protein
LLLCVPLIGSLFDSIIARLRTTKENIDWAYVLFQILYYDIIMLERDGEYFYTCYDMFSTLCCVMFGLNAALYEKFVAKIRRECPYIPEEMDKLSQLLPFPKSLAENSAWEYFYPSPQKAQISAATKNGNNTTQQQQQQTPKPKIKAVVLDRQPETAQQQLIKLLHHTHYHNFIRPQLPGFEGPGPDLFLSPPEMELVTDDLLEEPSPISNIMQTTDPSSTHLQVHRQHQQPHHIQQQDGSQVSQEQRHEQMHQFQSVLYITMSINPRSI